MQLKAQDEIWIENEGAEYEDYVRRSEELSLEKSEEYKAIVEASKERMRTIISAAGESNPDKKDQ